VNRSVTFVQNLGNSDTLGLFYNNLCSVVLFFGDTIFSRCLLACTCAYPILFLFIFLFIDHFFMYLTIANVSIDNLNILFSLMFWTLFTTPSVLWSKMLFNQKRKSCLKFSPVTWAYVTRVIEELKYGFGERRSNVCRLHWVAVAMTVRMPLVSD
jgi:hypothetical protein